MDHEEYLKSQASRFSGENKQAQGRLREAYKFFKPFIKKDKALLDIGSRDGWFLAYLEKKGYTDIQGIEITPEAVSHAKGRERNVAWGDAHDLSRFSEDQFTTILMIHSLEHCHDPDAVVTGISRLLKPGGVIYIEVPLEDEPSKDVAHFCNFTCVEDVHSLLGPGFELLKHQTVSLGGGIRHLLCGFRIIPE